MKRSKLWSVVGILSATMVLVLSGCVRLAVDLSVNRFDEISGSIVFAYPKATALLFETNPALQSARESYRSIEGAIERGYDQDGLTGTEIRLVEIPIEDFSNPSSGDAPITIKRQDDELRLEGSFDFSGLEEEPEQSGNSFTASLSTSRTDDLFVAVVLPGTITATNGLVDEDSNQVYWALELGQPNEIYATSLSPEPTPLWLWGVVLVGAGGLIGAGVFLGLKFAKSRRQGEY